MLVDVRVCSLLACAIAVALLACASEVSEPAGTSTSTSTSTSTTEGFTHSFTGPETVDCDLNPCPCGRAMCPEDRCFGNICVAPDCILGQVLCPCDPSGACDPELECVQELCYPAQDTTSGTSASEGSTSEAGTDASSSSGSTSGGP